MKTRNVFRERVIELMRQQGLTPAGLSKKIGKSQTWSSMFLTGKRDVPMKTAEQIAVFLKVDLWRLFTREPDARQTTIEGFVAVPLLATPIAAGAPLLLERDPEHDGSLAFREKTVRKFTDPICLRVGRHEESMRPLIHPRDIVVIDRNPKRRLPPVNGCIYAVNFGPLTGEEGGALKRIDLVDHALIINSDNPDKAHYPTQAFMLGREHNLLDILVGEVVWLGRYVGSRRGDVGGAVTWAAR